MKKYRFAKFYLAGLLGAALLLATIGVLGGLYYGSESVRAIILSQSLKEEPVIIDTASVFNAFHEATEILNTNNLATSADIHFDRQVPLGKSAKLSLKGIADFEVIIGQMSDSVASLKQQCIAKIQENLEQMISGSRSSLLSITALSSQTRPPNSTASMSYRTARRIPLLFVDGVVSDTDVELLKQCSEFLKLQVRNYTPSTTAQNLANHADTELHVLIVFLVNQFEAFKQSKGSSVNAITLPSTATSPATPTEQELRIRQFISYLQQIESDVESIIGKEWVIDQEIKNALRMSREAHANILSEIAAAKQRAKENGKQMVIWIVTSLVAALLLLVVRDFMSALIDSASNTGGMLDLMTPKDSDKTGDV